MLTGKLNNSQRTAIMMQLGALIDELYAADQLADWLEDNGLEYPPEPLYDPWESVPSGKILVVGNSACRPQHIEGIAKELGIGKQRLDLRLDYNPPGNLSNELQYSRIYAVILFGPIPHSMRGIDGYSSLINKLKGRQECYPPAIEITSLCSSNKLKITKTGFERALQCAIDAGYVAIDQDGIAI